MAPQPATSSQANKRTKRPAPDAAETPATKKSKLPWPLNALLTTGKVPAQTPEPDPPTITELARLRALKDCPDWQDKTIAERVDAIREARKELECENKLRSPAQVTKLDLQPDIVPTDTKWKKWLAIFEVELQETSVKSIFDNYFTEGQTLAIMPPTFQGVILDIQKTETEEYTKLLAAQLKGAKDNLATKLTMLHFGLPVAPMTLNNVFNAGKDEDDLPDAEADLPRVQRIMFAEKPLEFLDLYHQRSYGFPMLRRPQSKVHQASQLTTPYAPTQTTATEKELLTGKQLPLPIFPPQSTVVMRGGAGDPVNVYGLNGYGVQITDEREASEGEFLNAALSIIRLPKNTKTYAFTVDQYRNQEKNKDEPEKEFVKSFPVDQDSFSHVYNQYLKARLYNRQRDWPMVVRKTIDEKTSTFQIPAKLKKPPTARPLRNTNSGNSTTQTGPILPPPNTSPTKKPPPSPPKDSGKLSPNKKDPPLPPTGPNIPHLAGGLPGGSTTAANPGPNERVVYNLNGNRSAVFTNDHRSFYQAALKVVNQGGAGQGKVNFTVSQYNNAPARQAPDGKFAYVGSEEFLEGSDNLPQYRNSVASVMFKPMAAANYHEDWRIVAHTTAPHVVQNWPLTSASDEMVEVFVYYKINRPTGGAPSGAGAGGGAGTVGGAGTGGGAGAGEGAGGGPLTGAGPKPPITELSPAIKGGNIHGFGGRLNIQNTAADFQRGALQLLGIDPASAFLFYVSSPGSNLPKTVMVTQRTYSQKFESDIRPLMPGVGNWNIFVSKYRLSTEPPLEPEQEKRDIVRITYGHNIAYWKIPTNTTAEYGLNQLQEEYVRAIRVLFPSGAAGVAHIGAEKSGAIDLGYSGLELTRTLWERVTSDLNSQSSALAYTLTLAPNDHQDTIGVRMIGCVTTGHARATDYVQIHREIMGLQQFVQNGSPPKQFRLWKTAEDREKNGKSVLINYEPEATAVHEIEKFLNQQPGTETNCIWFRPEFGTFHFTDYGKLMNGAKVDVTGATLTDSISALQNLYHKANPQELFNKADPEAREDIVFLDLHSDSRFVLSEDTTACQFRKYVSDWFTGEEIYVQQNVKVGYQVEQMPPWGLLEASPVASTPEIQNKPTQTQSNQPPITGPIFPPPVPPYQHPLTGRINKDRIIKPRVSIPKPVTWAVWQAESNRQDRLQRDSYHRDQSVIEPGQQPAPPIFGPSRQTPLSTGSSMSLPEPYFIAMTPSDYARKAEENQILRNSCLERMSRCQLCDTSFPEYETDKIAEHLKSHIDALRQAGKCPLCACCWAALDMQQKKEHLWGHQKQCESDHMRNFWQGFQCPICDEELLGLASTDDVLAHMADHPPGLLRFCDRCGLDSTVCSLAHKKHHDQTCLETDQTGKLSFCNRCGKDRSSETEQDRKTHELTCKPNGSVFCTICGLSLSSMRDNQKHEHSLIHKAPGGPRKTFCKRCGKNLVTMSAEEKATHKQDCYLTLPRTFDTRERIQELENRIKEAKRLTAQNRAADARLVQKRFELQIRENTIKAKEAGLGVQAPESTAGPATLPDAFNCPLLRPDGSVCNQRITITACGGQIKAHYQHNYVPCVENSGGGAIHIPQELQALLVLQEFYRLYPSFKETGDRMQAAADKIRAEQKSTTGPTESTGPATGDPNAGTSQTAAGGTTGTTEKPNAGPPETIAPGTAGTGPQKLPPRKPKPAEDPTIVIPEPEPEPAQDGDIETGPKSPQDSTGFDRRRKAPASARKTSGKTPAGSKRKKAMIEDEEDDVGPYSGLKAAKTPRGGKRQKTTMVRAASSGLESSTVESDSGEEEPLVPPVSVRRTTRATSGTPGPTLVPPVARRAGRPKGRAGDAQLDEADEEEEVEILRSPGKRGRPQSPRKR